MPLYHSKTRTESPDPHVKNNIYIYESSLLGRPRQSPHGRRFGLKVSIETRTCLHELLFYSLSLSLSLSLWDLIEIFIVGLYKIILYSLWS